MSVETKTRKNALGRLFTDGTCINLTISNLHGKKFEGIPIAKKLNQIEVKARIWLANHTFNLVGNRFVPYSAFALLVNGDEGHRGLKALKEEFDKVFSEYMSEVTDSQLQEIGLEITDISDRVRFEWNVYSITTSDNNHESSDLVDQCNSDLNTSCLMFIGNTISEMSMEVINGIEKFKNVLSSGTTVKSSSIRAINNLIDNFRLMDIAGDERLMNLLSDLESDTEGVGSIKTDNSELIDKLINQCNVISEYSADFSRINSLVETYLSK